MHRSSDDLQPPPSPLECHIPLTTGWPKATPSQAALACFSICFHQTTPTSPRARRCRDCAAYHRHARHFRPRVRAPATFRALLLLRPFLSMRRAAPRAEITPSHELMAAFFLWLSLRSCFGGVPGSPADAISFSPSRAMRARPRACAMTPLSAISRIRRSLMRDAASAMARHFSPRRLLYAAAHTPGYIYGSRSFDFDWSPRPARLSMINTRILSILAATVGQRHAATMGNGRRPYAMSVRIRSQPPAK